jgi:hypothetical protein
MYFALVGAWLSVPRAGWVDGASVPDMGGAGKHSIDVLLARAEPMSPCLLSVCVSPRLSACMFLPQVGLTVLQYLVWVVQASIAAAQGGTGRWLDRLQSHYRRHTVWSHMRLGTMQPHSDMWLA